MTEACNQGFLPQSFDKNVEFSDWLWMHLFSVSWIYWSHFSLIFPFVSLPIKMKSRSTSRAGQSSIMTSLHISSYSLWDTESKYSWSLFVCLIVSLMKSQFRFNPRCNFTNGPFTNERYSTANDLGSLNVTLACSHCNPI